MMFPIGNYEVLTKLSSNAEDWNLAPHDKVEVNFRGEDGQERRLVFENAELTWSARGLLVVTGTIESLDGVQPVEFVFHKMPGKKGIWKLALGYPLSRKRRIKPSVKWFMIALVWWRRLMLIAGMFLGISVSLEAISVFSMLSSARVIALFLAIPEVIAWASLTEDEDYLYSSHRRMILTGGVIFMATLVAQVALSV
jgi:hypothetical protein